MPTTTWQAYNFYDADGDGWGDTWYARWKTKTVDTRRPHRDRGVPLPLPQLRPRVPPLARAAGKRRRRLRRRRPRGVRDAGRAPGRLRPARLPGAHRVRDDRALRPRRGLPRPRRQPALPLGEQLLPPRRPAGRSVTLIDEWRDLGRPEAELLGVQYVASDRGERHAPSRSSAPTPRRGRSGHRPRERLAVRHLRDRDRRPRIGVAAGTVVLARSPSSSPASRRR